MNKAPAPLGNVTERVDKQRPTGAESTNRNILDTHSVTLLPPTNSEQIALCLGDLAMTENKITPPLVPAKGSFRAILLENSSTRLYVHPLEWTASHLEYLSYHLHITDRDSTFLIEDVLPSGLTWEMVQQKLSRIRGKSKHGRDQNLREIVCRLGCWLCNSATVLLH